MKSGTESNNNSIEEDFEAWCAYPNHRWLFNKLELALKLDYKAGPTGVPVTKPGWYIVRPIYNLYGMGIGAKKVYLDPKRDAEDMINLAHVPPGYFWCEYFEGAHYSIDYVCEYGLYTPFSFAVGTHRDTDDLVQFDNWQVIDKPDDVRLPIQVRHLEEPRPKIINAEFKGNKLFEVHLRSGNDHMWNLPIGTTVYPVWKGETESAEMQELDFVGNMHANSFTYAAHGHLEHIRLGYRLQYPQKETQWKNNT